MGQPFVGQILAVGFPFTPVGWLACDGSLKSIGDYEALYSLIGTTYGGDGVNNFAVPDLRGRSPLSAGQGPGFSPYTMGQTAGTEQVTLTANQVGGHWHTLQASSQAGTTTTPGTGVVLAQNSEAQVFVYGARPANTSLANFAITASAGGQPHENRQPYLVINYIICYSGIFPPRS